MVTGFLQTPRMGRSRFSKALPLPPPSEEPPSPSVTSQTPRNLPNMSTVAAFPPRKQSIGARFAPKQVDSPLPAVPVTKREPDLSKKMPSIPRKAVGSPPPPQAAFQSPVSTKELRRNSSISSLLSAYSGSSSNSANRSSQSSSDTKDSVGSLSSPERDVVRGGKKAFGGDYVTYSRNPYEEPTVEERKLKMSEPLPPPPPKSSARSETSTSRIGLPSTPRSVKSVASPSSQPNLGNASPPRTEIWRRRAGSKSDGSPIVTDLKLPGSNGSTATTTTASPALPATSQSTSQLTSKSASTGAAALKASPLPPKPNSALPLPGRNIRPSQVAQDERLKRMQVDAPRTTPSSLVPGASPAVKIETPVVGRVSATTTGPGQVAVDTVSPSAAPKPQPQQASGNLVKPQDTEALARDPTVQKQASLHNLLDRTTSNSADLSLRGAKSAVELRGQNLKQQGGQDNGSPQNNNTVYRDAPASANPAQGPKPQGNPLVAATSPLPARTPLPPMTPRRARGPSQPEAFHITPQVTVTDEGVTVQPIEPVEYKDQEPVELSPRQQKRLDDAIDKVVSQAPQSNLMFTPTEDGIWPALPLSINHYKCLSDHRQFHYTRNEHYPIRCMVCTVADRHPRSVCKGCGLRICHDCALVIRGKRLDDVDVDAMKQARLTPPPIVEEAEPEALPQ